MSLIYTPALFLMPDFFTRGEACCVGQENQLSDCQFGFSHQTEVIGDSDLRGLVRQWTILAKIQ